MKVFFICYFRRSRWCVIIQFSAKDPKQESIKKLPKTDVRYEAYVGNITAFFASLVSKSFGNIHCKRPIVSINTPLVRMCNPPAGIIVTN